MYWSQLVRILTSSSTEPSPIVDNLTVEIKALPKGITYDYKWSLGYHGPIYTFVMSGM